MSKYWDSIKLLLLAICVLPLGFIWDDLALISSIAFITFIILAVQKAFVVARKQSFAATIKLLWFFSAVLALLVVLGLRMKNSSEPDPIGLGVYFMFILFPAAIGVIVMWAITLFSRVKNQKKPKNS